MLGKSCKMVPVMLFGILLAGKAKDYSMSDYIQVSIACHLTDLLLRSGVETLLSKVMFFASIPASAFTCEKSLPDSRPKDKT